MGKVCGHIKHFYKNVDMTFKEIQEFTDNLFNNSISGVVEKVDGQPIGMTYKDGQYLFAYFGEPKSLDDIINNELAKDLPKQVYREVGESLLYAFKDFPNPEEFFDSGNKILLMEIISKDMPNMIRYYKNTIIMHYLAEREGKKILSHDRYATYPIYAQIHQPDKYRISLPTKLMFNGGETARLLKKKSLSLIQRFMKENNLTENNTIWEYLVKVGDKWWIEHDVIGLYASQRDLLYKIVLNLTGATICKKHFPDNIRPLVDRFVDEGGKIRMMRALNQIEYLFACIINWALKVASNTTCADVEKSSGVIEKMWNDAFDYHVQHDNELFHSGKIINAFNNVKRIGEWNMYPSEGIVFDYKGQLYKSTGMFTDFITFCDCIRTMQIKGEYEYRG